MNDMPKMNYSTITKANIKSTSIDEMHEKHTEVDITASEFDITECYIGREDVTKKVIKLIERFCRSSFEYREYIDYLKNELDITKCAILDKIDINDIPVGIEFHHMPLSMFDISYAVACKMTDNDERVSLMQICEEVMREHYEGHIGLVPLTSTMHMAVHSGAIKIPTSKIYGNWLAFMNKYGDYLDKDMKSKIDDLLLLTDDEIEENNATKLQKNISDYKIKYTTNIDGGE